MRKHLDTLTLVMLISVTLLHIYFAGMLFISVLISIGTGGFVGFLQLRAWPLYVGLLLGPLPIFVLIRKMRFRKWTMLDAIFVWLGVAPGLFWCLDALQSYSTNVRSNSGHISILPIMLLIAYFLLGALTTRLMNLDRSPRILNSSGNSPKTTNEGDTH